MEDVFCRLKTNPLRVAGCLALAWLLFLLIPTSPPLAKTDKNIEVILDASGSMNGKLKSGEIKITAAKKAISDLLKLLADDTTLAFRAYGHRSATDKHDCADTELVVPFGSLAKNREPILSKSKNLYARGYTPITYVVKKAAEDFPGEFKGEKVIILVSDGKETCEGDPCATAIELARKNAKLVIHTVGFGVDEATRGQLECIARATGGTYFPAEDAGQLSEVLVKSVETSATVPVRKEGFGWLEVKGADFAGHHVTKADTGEKLGTISTVQSSMKLPYGIYQVTVGQSVWKSVEVKSGEKTVLTPGKLEVEHASLSGHNVVDVETGTVHGSVSNLKSVIALMPGEYQVMFGKLSWPVTIKAGEKTVLKPGRVQVVRASYKGHRIHTKSGEVAGEVSNIADTIPLPPGDYTVDVGGKAIPFTLREGERLKFEEKK